VGDGDLSGLNIAVRSDSPVRARFGVLRPAPNTTMAADLNRLSVPGVDLRYGALSMGTGQMANDVEHAAVLGAARASIEAAVAEVRPFDPTCLIMGLTIETFWGGVAGCASTTAYLRTLIDGRPVVTGPAACLAALQQIGARRIGVITPYQPAADTEVRRYFVEAGFDVVALVSLAASTVTDIAAINASDIHTAVRAVALPGVEAIIQCGTNLRVLDQIERIEAETGRPLLAMNAVTYWHALRISGIADRLDGFGAVLRA
jgi:maleate isomerase